ncbi:M20 family metallopeptidase [Pseudalkalibacillus sp. A8]|uniref:M20 family metallopeptidase n=1 Tax=Pseudalkalibacillus sp. A8 TaxID=3382641 RepID=UPI0038B45090
MVNNLVDFTDYFQSEELIEILQGLITEKSENPISTEESVAYYVRKLLVDNGIEANLHWAADGRPNVFAELKGGSGGPTLLYNGHLDVVPAGEGWESDPFEGVIRGGKLYGRGSADMKSGVAAMIYSAIVLKRMGNPFEGKLILFFTVDEERENLGMRHFLKENVSADYAIISEPTELNICIAHKGVARYRLRTKGTPQHAAKVKESDNNAITNMAIFIAALENLNKEIKKIKDPILENASLTVTQIKGGIAINVVPSLCEIEIDRRLLDGETEEVVMKQIENVLQNIAKINNIDYELENYLFLPATNISRDHLLVENLEEVVRELYKKDAKVDVFGATCEAPFLSVYKGIPTVICGPGSLEQAHIVDEYVEVQQVIDASNIFISLVLKILQSN